MKARLKSDVTHLISTRGKGGPLMYPGEWERVWIAIPGTGVWLLMNMYRTGPEGGAA